MTRMNRIALTAAASFTTLALVTAANAAVIVDPTLVGGTDAIDPAGSQTIDERPGTLDEAILEGRSDFAGAIQNLGVGFDTAQNSPVVNFIQFTDPTLADIRITVNAAGNSASGGNINDSGRVTSGSDGLRMAGGGTALFEFGEFDGTTFTSGKVVDAVGFVIGNIRATQGPTFTVTFRDSLGQTLGSPQVLTGGTEATTGTAGGDGIEGFFSFDSDGTIANGIASILVNRNGGGNIATSIDDFGFTSVITSDIPEPASLALMGLGGLLLVGGRGRRA